MTATAEGYPGRVNGCVAGSWHRAAERRGAWRGWCNVAGLGNPADAVIPRDLMVNFHPGTRMEHNVLADRSRIRLASSGQEFCSLSCLPTRPRAMRGIVAGVAVIVIATVATIVAFVWLLP